MNRKKIIFFSWTHLWSMKNGAGAPSYHHTISYYINSPDWDVYLFTADSTNLDLSIAGSDKLHLFTAPKILEYGMKIPKLNLLFRPLKLRAYNEWAEREIEKNITNWDNTYIYAYEIWGVEIAQKISAKHNCPLITRFQGTVLINKDNTFVNRLINYPHYEALSANADLIIMTDDGTDGKNVLEKLGNNSPCLFIRNGLDLYERYEYIHKNEIRDKVRKELNIHADEKILLMASRLTSWKRVERGIDALKGVLKIRQDVRLMIAGDGDQRAWLEHYAENKGVLNHVTFLGSVLQNYLYKYMKAADVFLSLYDLTNLGNPVFEAMLMKCPIISINNGATNTVLHDGDNCCLVEEDKLEEIPIFIHELLNNSQKKEKLVENAYVYAQKNFYNWEKRMQIEENAIISLDEQIKAGSSR